MKDYRSMDRRAVVLPLSGGLVFPNVTLRMRVTGNGVVAVREAQRRGRVALAFGAAGKNPSMEAEDLPQTGVLVEIQEISERDGGLDLQVRGLARIRRESTTPGDGFDTATFDFWDRVHDLDAATEDALVEAILQVSRETLDLMDARGPVRRLLEGHAKAEPLMDLVLQHIPLSIEEKQALLEIPGLREQALKLLDLLTRLRESLRLQKEMSSKISEQAGKAHRENLLREQLKAIQEQLHEGKTPKQTYQERLRTANLPQHVLDAALEEADRLESLGQGNPEASVLRNWLDLILALPWDDSETPPIDLQKARGILEEDHYGLEKIKERILQFLAVLKLKPGKKGALLLLAGPPGVGKTSLGKSIAKALDREFIRASLGGVRDDADIRGHRRTYVGALPGRILQSLKRAKSRAPVFLLDEIDKLGKGWGGDPASALLEVLDPEQNAGFTDHYLDLPYDLSRVFFIATANNLDSIPAPLLDRMELINLAGYTEREKTEIARRHLWPKALEEHGIPQSRLALGAGVLEAVVSRYTREAGVRQLERQLAALARVKAPQVAEQGNGSSEPVVIHETELHALLGREMHHPEESSADNPPGVATGLAWTPVGGDILFVETAALPGTGEVVLTGQLGEVMKESARLALSLIRAHLPFTPDPAVFRNTDWHIHVPAGATPKDGPSAGIALLTALASLATGRKVDPKLAMTGEITLRGAVLPVGGIKEKVLAAYRSGIKSLLLPKKNEPDYQELPEDVRAEMAVTYVETAAEVLDFALGLKAVDVPPPFLASGSPAGNALP